MPKLQTRPRCWSWLVTWQNPGHCYSKTKTETILKKADRYSYKALGTVSAPTADTRANARWIYFPAVDSLFHRRRVLSSFLLSWCEWEEAGRITHITEVETERVRAEREETAPTAADMKANASTDIQTLDHKTVDTRLLRLDWLVSRIEVLNSTAVVGW